MSDKYAAVTTPRLLPLSRVREIADGSQLLMGEAADLAKTAIQLTEELSIATDSFQDAGRRLFQAEDRIAELLAERDADKRRIAELTGKPAEDYADDAELLFCIDYCDDVEYYRTAQWLKELRRRRVAGISLKEKG